MNEDEGEVNENRRARLTPPQCLDRASRNRMSVMLPVWRRRWNVIRRRGMMSNHMAEFLAMNCWFVNMSATCAYIYSEERPGETLAGPDRR